MAVDQLRLQVLLQAVDKASGALKNVATGSKATAQAIRAAQDEARKLEKLQNDASGYQRTSVALRGHARDLAQAKSKAEQYGQQLQEQRTRHSNIAASLRTARHAYNQITTAYQDSKITGAEYTRQIELARITLLSAEQAHGRSKASVDKYKAQVKNATDKVQQHTAAIQGGQERLKGYKARLEEAGLSTERLGAQKRSLKARIDAQTTAMARSKASYEQQMQVEKRLHALREKHGADMARLGMRGAMAAGAMMAGQRMGGALMRPVQAFADAESATSQLRAAMMRADGTVPPEFAKINELAERLGDKLPGTTADFINMMTMLQRQGMSTQTILGGMGEAAAYLGVQLKMPVTAAAEFAAKMQDATQTTEGDLMGLMDLIQRSFYLGVDPTNMLQGFTKVGAVMPYLGKKGLEASNMLAPMLVMFDQAGMKGEEAGNALRKVVNMSMNEGKLSKANGMLKGTGIQLEFFDKKGHFAGFDNLFAQLDKLKTIDSHVKRSAVMEKLFGDDAQTFQVLNTLMEKGKAGYDETVAKLQAQADLRMRVNEQLKTVSASVEAAQGSFTNMLKDMGATIAPDLVLILNKLGALANSIGAWTRENQAVVKWGLRLVGVVSVLAVGVGALGLSIASVLGPMMIARFLMARLALSMGAARTAAAAAGPAMGFLARMAAWVGRVFSFVPVVLGYVWRALLVLGRVLMLTPWGRALGLLATAAMMIYQNWDGIKGGLIAIWEQLSGATAAWWASTTAGAAALWQTLVSLKDRFFTAGGDLMDGLVNGITSRVQMVRDAIGGVADDVGAWFREKLGIASPSKVFMQYGGWISEGAALGIQGGQGAVRTAALAMATAATSAVPMAAGAAALGPDGQPTMQPQAMRIDTRPPLTAPAMGPGQGVGGSTYNITINAAPGMDPKELARVISAELDRRERSKKSQVLSAFSDID